VQKEKAETGAGNILRKHFLNASGDPMADTADFVIRKRRLEESYPDSLDSDTLHREGFAGRLQSAAADIGNFLQAVKSDGDCRLNDRLDALLGEEENILFLLSEDVGYWRPATDLLRETFLSRAVLIAAHLEEDSENSAPPALQP